MDFVNRGRFSPGVTVRTSDMVRRDLPPNAYASFITLDTPTSCVAVTAHYADGTTWQNPSVDAAEPGFPAAAP